MADANQANNGGTPPPNSNNGNEKPSEKGEKVNGGASTFSASELDQIQKDATEYKDKYLRLLADADNARKRMLKERQELTQYAVENVIVDFLDPIDHFENALSFTKQSSEEVKHWALGFQMILKQLKDALSNNGVEPFVSEGMPFDPHFHEAIEMVSTDKQPEGTIIEVSLKGYKMGERVIRPARVKVACSPEVNQINESNQK